MRLKLLFVGKITENKTKMKCETCNPLGVYIEPI